MEKAQIKGKEDTAAAMSTRDLSSRLKRNSRWMRERLGYHDSKLMEGEGHWVSRFNKKGKLSLSHACVHSTTSFTFALTGCVFQARIATFELYRRSTIGNCLTETLDEMVQNGTLSHELAIQVLVQFDKSMTEALETQVKSKVSIKDCLGAFNLLLVIVRGGIDLC
ncbi:transcription initiation factor IIA subunit [Trifolium repens]|nr:transcription initiation factor IIA subunit [Trifolium repens]